MERLGSMPRPFEQWPSRFMAKILPKRKKWRLIVFTRALHAADHAWLLMLLHGAFYEFENLKAVNLFFPGQASSSSSCRPCVPFPVVPGQRLIFDVNQSWKPLQDLARSLLLRVALRFLCELLSSWHGDNCGNW